MMANSARDPYWQAGVRRESMDHPESKKLIEDECSVCHMPMARTVSKAMGQAPQIFAHLPFDAGKPLSKLAQDGVSCSLCHQITEDKLGTKDSYVGGYVVDTKKPRGERTEYGPYEVEKGHNRIMRTSSGGAPPLRASISGSPKYAPLAIRSTPKRWDQTGRLLANCLSRCRTWNGRRAATKIRRVARPAICM